jgi:hypothetical protein
MESDDADDEPLVPVQPATSALTETTTPAKSAQRRRSAVRAGNMILLRMDDR